MIRYYPTPFKENLHVGLWQISNKLNRNYIILGRNWIEPPVAMTFLLPPATKLGQGYVFTGVCHSVNRGGVPDQVNPPRPGTPQPPPDQAHPPPDQAHHPPLDQAHHTPPRTRHTTPPDQAHHTHPPRPGTPPLPRTRACWEIQSTRGRYASYWNAILFHIFLC